MSRGRGGRGRSRRRRHPRREPRYDLVFAGTWDAGQDRAQVLASLAALFRLREPRAVESFLDRGPVALRRNLPRERAKALLDELAGSGLHCHLAPFDDRGTLHLPTPAPVPLPAPVAPQPASSPAGPNLFALEPYRPARRGNRDAAELTSLEQALRRAVTAGAVACLLLLVLLAQRAPPAPIATTDSASVGPGGGLLLRSGPWLALHDRAGNGLLRLHRAALGLAAIEPEPLTLLSDQRLLLRGRVQGAEGSVLLRCRLRAPRGCDPLAVPAAPVTATAAAAAGRGAGPAPMFLALGAPQRALLRLGSDAAVEATATPAPEAVVTTLQARDGLLYAADQPGATLSVLSPDIVDFGRRLDLLLLPTPDDAGLGARIEGLARLGEGWLVLFEEEDGDRRLWHFDRSWQALEAIDLPGTAPPRGITSWGKRVLVSRAGELGLTRIGASGQAEVAYRSPLLEELRRGQLALVADHRHRRRMTLGLALIIAAAGMVAVALVRQRRRDFAEALPQPCPISLTTDTDPRRWLQRPGWQAWRRSAGALGAPLVAAAAAPAALGASALPSVLVVAGAVSVLAGVVLSIRDRTSAVAIGDDHMVLVDHRGHYHAGAPAELSLRGPFLFRDDVLVLLGNRWLPLFERADAIARGCRKRGARAAQWRQVLLRLALSGHPCLWSAGGVAAIAAGVALALPG